MVLVQKELKNAYIGEYVETGIFHNSTLGLISLSSDGHNWITIADKNLGATAVYNYGDTLTAANCGKFYQWGNNYGFARSGATTTSSSTVNASTYGPGNYYSSSTFITSQPRDNSYNTNLWGGTTDTNAARKGPCDTGYHVPSLSDSENLYNIIVALSLSANNYSSYLKFPKPGSLTYSTGVKGNVGTIGYCWISTHGPNNNNAYYMGLQSSVIRYNLVTNINSGYNIRPFKNEAVQPDASRTKLY